MDPRRWIVGVGFGIYTALLLFTPGHLWTSGTFTVAWDLGPRWAWAIGFGAVSATALIPRVPQWFAGALLAGHCAAWAGVLFVPVITGEAESPASWVWPAMLCAFVLRSAAAE